MAKNVKCRWLALALAAALVGCGSGDSSSRAAASIEESAADTTTTTTAPEEPASEEESTPDPAPEPEVESCKIEDESFGIYKSNTYFSTGNNGLADAESTTFRAFLPVEEYGELEYRFYFSNTVDSTYSRGDPVYVGRPGGEYEIESAFVYALPDTEAPEPEDKTPVTFDGAAGRSVSAGESFWSDSLTLEVPEGSYLVWEWTLTGKDIPATNISELTLARQRTGDGEYEYLSDCPLPVLVGAKRSADHRLCFVGDSITQGCQTEYMKFEYWAARIAQQLPESVSTWNCGLGWARASDLATCGSWLGRALNCETIVLAFGTNDLTSGEYGRQGRNNGNNADELLGFMTTILDQCRAAGIERVIVFNAPPQDYNEKVEAQRVDYNERLRDLCEEKGAEYFDFAALLCDPETPAAAKYGGHPNGEAGAIVAEAFLEQFSF